MIEPSVEVDRQHKADKIRNLSKAKWCLLGCVITILVLVVCSVLIPYWLNDAVRLLGDNDFASKLRAIGKQDELRDENLVEMIVENVGISETSFQPVVILKQKNGDTRLPIVIGFNEVTAIAVILEGIQVPRPLTSDLLCTIIDKTGSNVDYIVITDIKEGIFYANIALRTNWIQLKIDSRSSDAIAIALRVKAPIYVNKTVLDKAGISPDNKPKKYETAHLNRDTFAITSRSLVQLAG